MVDDLLIENCKPSIKIIMYNSSGDRIIAGTAKLTLSSKDVSSILSSLDDEDVGKWVVELIRRGHGTPLEHAYYGFEITCSRIASHQLVRHRIASYTQLSQRRGDKLLRNVVYGVAEYLGVDINGCRNVGRREAYLMYARLLNRFLDEIESIDASVLYGIVCQGFILPPQVVINDDRIFVKDIVSGLMEYYQALAKGYVPEDSRYLLPQSVKTRLYVTMNARELVENFIPLRTCSRAQWEIRYIAWNMLRELMRIHPRIFMYTGPRCILYENRVRQNPISIHDVVKDNAVFTIQRCPELVPKENMRDCILHSMRDPWNKCNYIIS